jgi:hypothetical protein
VQQPVLPFWFKQRQCKAEPAGDNVLRVSGPNLGEAYLYLSRAETGRWRAGLRQTADGPDVITTAPEIETPREAWDAAFELYREQMIV